MLAITWQFYTFILSTTVVQVLTTYIPTDLSSTSMPMRPRKVVKPTAIRDICFVKPSHGAHTSPTAVNRDAGDLCCFFFELATFAFLSSWQPFNTGDRLLYCTVHGRWNFSCHIQRGNVPRVSGCRSSLQRQNGESKFDLHQPVARQIRQCSPSEWQLSIVAFDHCLSETNRIGRAHL